MFALERSFVLWMDDWRVRFIVITSYFAMKKAAIFTMTAGRNATLFRGYLLGWLAGRRRILDFNQAAGGYVVDEAVDGDLAGH